MIAGVDLLGLVERRDLVEVDHDRLDLLGAHHRAHAAARGEPRRAAVLVAEGDAREEALVLADGAAQGDGDLLAVVRVQHLVGLEVALAEVRGGVVERDGAVLLEVDHHPARRGAVQREARDLLLAEAVAEGAAAVGLLDAAGERALAADARAVGIGEARAGEGSRREDERVGGDSGSTVAAPSSSSVLRDQVAAGLDDVVAVQLPRGDRAVGQLDIVVLAHDVAPRRSK